MSTIVAVQGKNSVVIASESQSTRSNRKDFDCQKIHVFQKNYFGFVGLAAFGNIFVDYFFVKNQ